MLIGGAILCSRELRRYRFSKTPMAPRRAPLTEQIERRISDPLCGAGGGFPLRQREYTFSRRLPSGPAALGRLTLGPGRSLLRERRTEAVHQLPKLRTRVRFPSLAPP